MEKVMSAQEAREELEGLGRLTEREQQILGIGLFAGLRMYEALLGKDGALDAMGADWTKYAEGK